MTLAEVLAKAPVRSRYTLKRTLTPARYEAILRGLAERRWTSMEQARRELGATRGTMNAIRSALRLAGVLSWGGSWEAFSLDAKATPRQTALFVATKEGGYRYTQQ